MLRCARLKLTREEVPKHTSHVIAVGFYRTSKQYELLSCGDDQARRQALPLRSARGDGAKPRGRGRRSDAGTQGRAIQFPTGLDQAR